MVDILLEQKEEFTENTIGSPKDFFELNSRITFDISRRMVSIGT